MNGSKVQMRSAIGAHERTLSTGAIFGVLLGVSFLLRLIFMGNAGFSNDISSFEAWSYALATHPFAQFYTPKMFADYPPGYFYVLAAIGHLYFLIAPHGNLDVLKYLVKLPAVIMDLVDGALLFAIVRRFAGERWALGTAAVFLLNPAVIFISAAWGQVDSISGGLALLGVYLLLRSEDEAPRGAAAAIAAAWLALAYSLLIKPQAAVLVPLFLAFAFVSAERRSLRVAATAAGIAGSLILAFLVTVPFHPTANPAAAFLWLYEKYNFGKNVYPFNSVNAFNLWSIRYAFWQPDSLRIGPLAQSTWGILLVACSTALIVVRYVQARTPQALIEAAALLTLGFFMLATRMHERYIFDGLLFTIAAIPFAVRYAGAAAIFSFTLLVNLFYSLTYLHVMQNGAPGVNAADMWWPVPHLLSLLNVGTFFFLGYLFLGQSESEAESARFNAAALRLPAARSWFNPREGLAALVWPLDYVMAGLFGIGSFVLSYVNYWLPNEKVFDEIYFARAAEEYLTHKYIYENTHPPLTKLIITLSTMLFGGMAHGDNPHGWRFLDVVFGAIVIVILYAFAKRLTRSTLFASAAALMFTCDNMHFVQSRIATPEGIVIVFSLGTLYAFYRFWIASQSTVRAREPATIRRALGAAAGALVIGYAISALLYLLADVWKIPGAAFLFESKAAFIVFGLYFAFGAYLALRLFAIPRFFGTSGELASYPEGSLLRRDGDRFVLETPDGGVIDSTRKNASAGTLVRAAKGTLAFRDDAYSVTYERDGSATYATPEGTATYSPGRLADDAGGTEDGRHATGWLVTFTVLLGALVASKWYGVMAYGVSFVAIVAVWFQRYWRPGKLKRWGNPYGFRLDIAIAAIVFLSMTVYIAVWIPDFIRQIEIKNLSDLIYRQYSMFEYHDTLKATHPYQSSWWQWPLDLRPIAYYWKDLRTGLDAGRPGACCVAEIISFPNPLILWFGLFCVPAVAFFAWREKNKGYALLILAYLLQWLPWAESPRITFAYHFYVDVPLIVLCNVIVLQRVWEWGKFNQDAQTFSRLAVAAYVVAVVGAFVWFYPILSATPIPWNAWHGRMWLGSHWV